MVEPNPDKEQLIAPDTQPSNAFPPCNTSPVAPTDAQAEAASSYYPPSTGYNNPVYPVQEHSSQAYPSSGYIPNQGYNPENPAGVNQSLNNNPPQPGSYPHGEQPVYNQLGQPLASPPVYSYARLTRVSQSCVCTNCRNNIQTRVTKTTGYAPWVFCGGLCISGCWFFCCLIPFCIDGLKDVEHRCPNCGYVIGIKKLI